MSIPDSFLEDDGAAQVDPCTGPNMFECECYECRANLIDYFADMEISQ